MTIYADAYQTPIGLMYDATVKHIDQSIRESIIKDNLDKSTLNVFTQDEVKPLFITGLTPSEANIKLFTHPITVKNFKGTDYLCTDMRIYLGNVSKTDNFEDSIRNRTEYNFAKSRAIINLVWVNNGVDNVKNTLKFGAQMFASWISETVSRAYALDYKDQCSMTVIAYAYYHLLFKEYDVLTDNDKQLIAVQLISNYGFHSSMIYEILDKVNKSLNCIEDFCTACREVLENVRLNDFTSLILMTLVRNSWYGNNSKEIIAISLEHPPTWLAIVYACLNERTFKTTPIYKLAEKLGKRGRADEFINSYTTFIKSNLAVSQESDQLVIRDYN
jgi:hypothetical protein